MSTSFELLGAQGGRDENGIASVTVPYFAQTIDEVFSVGAATYLGLPQVSRTFQANEDGTFTVQVTYDGGDSSSMPGREKPTYSLNSSFEEEPIEAHPNINDIVTKYGGTWKDGRVTFPSKMPDEKKDTGGLSNAGTTGDSEQKPNPMCGVEKYKKLSVQWSVTYAATVIPGSVLAAVGRVISNPPGSAPQVAGRTKWLVMPPTASKRGNVAEITENYFLLDEGTATEIYKLGSIS